MKLTLLTFPTVTDVLFRRISFMNLCKAVKENGLVGLDMMMSEVSLYGVKKVRRALKENELYLSSLIAYAPMGKGDKKVKARLEKAVRRAHELDCKRIMLVPMGQFEAGGLKATDKERLFENYVKGFGLASEICKREGIALNVEDTPTCYLPLSSTEECALLLNAVDGLSLTFDTANMLPGGSEPNEFYEKLKGKVTHVHLKDVEYLDKGQDACVNGKFIRCCDYGKGVVPVRELCEKLLSDGYDGEMAIEYTSPKKRNYISHKEHIKEFVDYLKG